MHYTSTLYPYLINFDFASTLYPYLINFDINSLAKVDPQIEYLSQILTVITVFMSIAYPLMKDQIFKLSEKYNSDYIAEEYAEEYINKRVPIMILVGIIAIVGLTIYSSLFNEKAGLIKLIIATVVYLYFIVNLCFIVIFFIIYQKYTKNSDYLLLKLNGRMKKLLIQNSFNKYESSVSTKWSLNKLYPAQREMVDLVNKGLKAIFKYLIKIEDSDKLKVNIEKYSNIIKESILKYPDYLFSAGYKELKNKNPSDADFRLLMLPEDAMAPLDSLLNIPIDLYQDAVKQKNDIRHRIAEILPNLICSTSKLSNNLILLESMLKKNYKITEYALEQDRNSFLKSFEWYSRCIGNGFFPEVKKARTEYHETLNKAAYFTLVNVIDSNKIDSFNDVTNHVLNNMPDSRAFSEEERKKIVGQQKCYMELFWMLAIYCIFKKKHDYIKHIWEAKQPADTDSTWMGHDIVPENITEICNLYFKFHDNWSLTFSLLPGRHDIKQYSIYYFIMIISRYAKKDTSFITSLNLTNYGKEKLLYYEYQINEALGQIEKIPDSMWSVLFPNEDNITLKTQCKTSLKLLIDNIKKSYEEKDEQTAIPCDAFAECRKITESYDKASDILKNLNFDKTLIHLTKADIGKKEKICYRDFYDRSMFFEKSNCKGLSTCIGQSLGTEKTGRIIDKMIAAAQESSSLDDVLDKIKENSDKEFIIFTSFFFLYNSIAFKNQITYNRTEAGETGTLNIDGREINFYETPYLGLAEKV